MASFAKLLLELQTQLLWSTAIVGLASAMQSLGFVSNSLVQLHSWGEAIWDLKTRWQACKLVTCPCSVPACR